MYWFLRNWGMNNFLRGLGLLWILSSVVFAESPDSLIQNRLLKMQTMHAHFTQTVHAKKRLIMQSSGEMVLAKPNRFRWQTNHPMAQTVIADGKTVWIYDVELEQVTVSKQTKKLGIAGALFLSADINVIRGDFVVHAEQDQTTEIFDLRAKSSKSTFERVRLVFKKDVLTEIALDDQLGQHTLIHLSHVVMNHPEPAHLFQFRIPAGVDVVHQ